jgi:hypothetical protein
VGYTNKSMAFKTAEKERNWSLCYHLMQTRTEGRLEGQEEWLLAKQMQSGPQKSSQFLKLPITAAHPGSFFAWDKEHGSPFEEFCYIIKFYCNAKL